MLTHFWLENLKGRDHTDYVAVDWRVIIKMDLREIGWEVVNWIHLA
jgi:hypothetical protein